MEPFNIEIKAEDLKEKIEFILEQQIKEQINNAQYMAVLGENIKGIFKTTWDRNSTSRFRNIIDEAIEGHIRNCIYAILDRTDIKDSIEKAIESNLKDSDFINRLAKAKTFEILTQK